MRADYSSMLDGAESLADIFEVVKSLVRRSTGMSRGGLMLGMANLGNNPRGILGGFFAAGSNVIVLNRVPLCRIRETRPQLYRPYAFYVLLHEYLHSLGEMDEEVVRSKVCEITRDAFGEEHLATQLASGVSRFITHLAYPDLAWGPEEGLEIVEGFDRSSVTYIA